MIPVTSIAVRLPTSPDPLNSVQTASASTELIAVDPAIVPFSGINTLRAGIDTHHNASRVPGIICNREKTMTVTNRSTKIPASTLPTIKVPILFYSSPKLQIPSHSRVERHYR